MSLIPVPAAMQAATRGFYPKVINGSLRFNDDDSAYLSRTPASASNQKTWTWSGWVKRGESGDGTVSNHHFLFSASTTQCDFYQNGLRFYSDGGTYIVVASQKLRDYSAWYHIVVSVDTTQATASDRFKIYINGEQVTDFSSTAYPPLNHDTLVNSTNAHFIGKNAGTNYLHAYLADVHFIDGQALTPSSFAETKNGVWVAKDYEGTYGTNGFHLEFAGNANDSAGSNNWTANNITSSDYVSDSPTDNFATLNPLDLGGNGTLSNGNLDWSVTSGDDGRCYSTIAMSSGKWYWEVTQTDPDRFGTGIVNISEVSTVSLSNDIGGSAYEWGFITDGQIRNNATASSYGSAIGNGGVLMVAFDADNGELYFGKDGTWFNSSNPSTNTSPAYSSLPSGDYLAAVTRQTGDDSATFDFGQLGFTYTPPTGFNALSTANLPDPVIDPAQDSEPRDYFQTFTYTGNGTGLQVGDVIKKPADTTTIAQSVFMDDGTYLDSGSISAATDAERRTWAWSGWIKRNSSNQGAYLLNQTDQDGSGADISYTLLGINGGGTDTVNFADRPSSANDFKYTSSERIMPDGQWHHLLFHRDSTTSANNKLWIDGVQATLTQSGSFVTNQLSSLGSATGGTSYNTMRYGRNRFAGTEYAFADYYLAEVHFVQGSLPALSTFGEFDANGIWIPKTVTGLTYGTHGHKFTFADSSSFGDDTSGNAFDFTGTNFATTDQVADSPTNNCLTFGTRHPVVNGSVTLSEGNLVSLDAGTTYGLHSFTEVGFTTGKYYWEIEATDVNAYAQIGVYNLGNSVPNSAYGCIGYVQTGYSTDFEFSSGWAGTGNVAGSGATYTDGDVIGVALNMDDQEITFYKNGVEQFTKTWSIPNIQFAPAVGDGQNATTAKFTANFGQRTFAHTVPTGFVAPTENNITVDDQNLESPDFVWIKQRNTTRNHQLFDAVRGVKKGLSSSTTDAESNAVNMLVDFNTNGFTVGSDVAVNAAGGTYVAWNWKANGSGVANNVGSIPSTVSANTDSGFSVITWTGNATLSATIGHGLSSSPEFMIFKNRSVTNSWIVQHHSVTGYLTLNSTNAVAGSNVVTPSSTTIQFDSTWDAINGNTNPMLCYAFHSVEGFSKIGTYEGTNNSNGPYIYLGFKPKFFMLKNADSVMQWIIFDGERDPINVVGKRLFPSSSSAESAVPSNSAMDFTSNGVKIRIAGGYDVNDVGTYVYMAFAENPFKYSLAR